MFSRFLTMQIKSREFTYRNFESCNRNYSLLFAIQCVNVPFLYTEKTATVQRTPYQQLSVLNIRKQYCTSVAHAKQNINFEKILSLKVKIKCKSNETDLWRFGWPRWRPWARPVETTWCLAAPHLYTARGCLGGSGTSVNTKIKKMGK